MYAIRSYYARVPEVDAVAEHHRARAADDADAVLTAVIEGVLRDARALSKGSMHPDAGRNNFV